VGSIPILGTIARVPRRRIELPGTTTGGARPWLLGSLRIGVWPLVFAAVTSGTGCNFDDLVGRRSERHVVIDAFWMIKL